jgi:Z1 domain
MRRWQQSEAGIKQEKYSFLFHTEQSRLSHSWQERVVLALNKEFLGAFSSDDQILKVLLENAYEDLEKSLVKGKDEYPSFDKCYKLAKKSIIDGELMVTKVNSDKQIDELLDDDGQLKLRTPLNVFIGGQILDRGITIRNLIGFYYGRNPKKFQQDTVLQHSRMYGARHKSDLPVTRFYAPLHVYQVMKKIHEFDSALREAFESHAHERGVYFIHRDIAHRISPCSPNKLVFSKLTSAKPGSRLLPVGFQTIPKTSGKKGLKELDSRISKIMSGKLDGDSLIDVERATELLALAHDNFEWPDGLDETAISQPALLEHLSRTANPKSAQGKVLLLTASGRDLARQRDEGRFSNAPDTKQQRSQAQQLAGGSPVLVLLREEGTEAQGWRGLPFWWPVVVVPPNAPTTVFAAQQPHEEAKMDELPQ